MGILLLISGMVTAVTAQKVGSALVQDNFCKPLNTSRWIVEMVPTPQSSVYTESGKLVLDTKGGVTVWLNKLLSDNIHISFDRKVVVGGKLNDRLSDGNVFWMATDLRNRHLFTRNGVFESYDSLSLYYVGMGGNTNTTTRFRKYEGNGQKILLQEYLDAAHLLTANQTYHVDIVVKDGVVTFSVDDIVYFSYNDPSPLRKGYFGFRSTWSRQEISNFSVKQLP